MARGWESKSVEEQQSIDDRTAVSVNTARTKQEDMAARAKHERQKQELELQRERILSERTSNPLRRAALVAALTDIEARLALLA
jgi:hypothetical protein